MDEVQIEKIGVHRIKTMMSQWGGWPVVTSNWSVDNFTWYDTIYIFRKTGLRFSTLFTSYVYIDLKNSSRRVLYLDQPSLGLPRSYFMAGANNSVVQAYLQYMVDISVALGADRTSAITDMKAVLDFEAKLAELSLPDELRYDLSSIYNKVTIEELMRQYPGVPWLEYINTMLAPYCNLTLNDSVVNLAPSFFLNFTSLIQNEANRTISNYLGWHVVTYLTDYLTTDLKSIRQEFLRQLYGQIAQPPRSKICINEVKEKMPAALGSLYVRRFFDKDAKQETENIVSSVKAKFDTMLDEITWMDNITKSTARNKYDAMKANVGYPDELLNDTLLNKLYEGLNITREHYLDNVLQFNLFQASEEFRGLKLPVGSVDWTEVSHAADVNAYYHRVRNDLNIPARILQGVYFSKGRPKYALYGAIGTVVGHEVTQGFDLLGRQFDQCGNQRDWWQNETNRNFMERAQCFVEQYGNITVPEFNVTLNGQSTLNGNIADNGAIRESYRTYGKWVDTHGEEKKLPGLKFSPKQLLWMSFANIYCSKERPEHLAQTISAGGTLPNKYRVNVPAGNMDQFAKDWNCTRGSPMIPKKNCSIW